METNRSRFFQISGWAAYSIVGLTLAEIILFSLFPQPETIRSWFVLFEHSPLVGLMDFWGLELLMYVLFVVVFAALYAVLQNQHQELMLIMLSFVIIGAAIFFATNNPFTMLTLSRRFNTAVTESECSALLAAGEAVLAGTNQRVVGGFNIGLFLVSIAGLLASRSMLRSSSFSRSAALIGFLAHGFSLADYLRQALTQEPLIALMVILPGALLIMIWFSLVGKALIKKGRDELSGK